MRKSLADGSTSDVYWAARPGSSDTVSCAGAIAGKYSGGRLSLPRPAVDGHSAVTYVDRDDELLTEEGKSYDHLFDITDASRVSCVDPNGTRSLSWRSTPHAPHLASCATVCVVAKRCG